ncbi:MAG TPA: septum formation protein Maf, partial [Ruminococcaceae bacterium]|nr:septum formation protein Maf [Oscillospiraceae bacterium]
MSLILASASPRRRELLSLYTTDFKIVVSDADEYIEKGTPPEDAAKAIAERKAQAVFELYPDDIVIGADTIVVLDDKIFGKPADENDAFNMLKALSGREHFVMTGVCICCKNTKKQFVSKTKVTFNSLTDEEINRYIST